MGVQDPGLSWYLAFLVVVNLRLRLKIPGEWVVEPCPGLDMNPECGYRECLFFVFGRHMTESLQTRAPELVG